MTMRIILTAFLLMTSLIPLSAQDEAGPITLAIHGGAGTITRQNMTPEKEKAYREALQLALKKGYEKLKSGASALDAVEAAIHVMEESPLFNAGKGAVFTNEGKNELDASIMDDSKMQAGAVAGVTTIKSPITAARAVMEKSPHVLMVGKGAEKFAAQEGLEIVDPSYFYTETRYRQLKEAQKNEKIQLDHSGDEKKEIRKAPKSGKREPKDELIFTEGEKFGTVGCVALDKFGNLAAGTSTGGMTNKRFGRVGDSPVIGAGTYANNRTCAVSSTGHGEYFIRNVVAYDVSALMEYKGLTVQQAAEEVIMKKLTKSGGDGGLIALDRKGNVAFSFNSEGMYRGLVKADGSSEIQIYKD